MRQEISRLRVSSKRFPSTPPYRHVPSLEMTVAADASLVISMVGAEWRHPTLQIAETTPCTPLVISTVAGQPPIGKPLIVQARGQLRLTWRLYAESPQSGEISLLHGQESITAGDLSAQSIIEAVSIYPPIPARSSARDDGGGGRLSRHFDSGSGVETSYASNSRNDALHPSRHFDESAAEWRNLLPPMRQVTCHHFEGKGSIS